MRPQHPAGATAAAVKRGPPVDSTPVLLKNKPPAFSPCLVLTGQPSTLLSHWSLRDANASSM
jgi:hypothetical protein